MTLRTVLFGLSFLPVVSSASVSSESPVPFLLKCVETLAQLILPGNGGQHPAFRSRGHGHPTCQGRWTPPSFGRSGLSLLHLCWKKAQCQPIYLTDSGERELRLLQSHPEELKQLSAEQENWWPSPVEIALIESQKRLQLIPQEILSTHHKANMALGGWNNETRKARQSCLLELDLHSSWGVRLIAKDILVC